MSKQSTKSKSNPRSAARVGSSRSRSPAYDQNGNDQRSSRSSSADRIASRASGLAHEAADTVMEAASESAATISRQLTQLLDKQLADGAGVMNQVASSVRLAADDLDDNVPQVAGVVRTLADKVDSYGGKLREQSIEQMFGSASALTRRQPGLVFGLAAVAGFLVFRTFSVAPRSSKQPRSGMH